MLFLLDNSLLLLMHLSPFLKTCPLRTLANSALRDFIHLLQVTMLKELGTVLGFSWYFCSHIAVFHPTNTLQIDTEKSNCLAREILKLNLF